MKQNITIVGANSYIARNLIRVIDKDKFELFLYDRDESHFDGYANYSYLDILNPQAVERIKWDCENLFWFSGATGTSVGFEEYKSFVEVNELGLLNALSAHIKAQSKSKIVFPSTRLVYKGSDEPLTEDCEKEFKTPYALNKFSCENYLKMFYDMFGIPYCVFRICLPYGEVGGIGSNEGESFGTVGAFSKAAKNTKLITIYGDGAQKRTLTHMSDLCEIMWQGAQSPDCHNDVYNIGGKDVLSLAEIAEEITKVFGGHVKNVPWPEFDKKLESGSTVFDSTKLDKILEYKYKYGFEQWVRNQEKR